MNRSFKSLLAAAFASLLAPAAVQAQLPSTLTDGVQEMDTSLFANVFNLPADDPVDASIVGDMTGATLNQFNVDFGGFLSSSNEPFFFTEVNILSGGDTASSIDFTNAEINILSGGELGSSANLNSGATLNASSGSTIGTNLDLRGNAILNFSGGTLGANVIAFDADTTINISGGSINSVDSSGIVNITGGNFIAAPDFLTGSVVSVSDATFGNNADFNGTTTIDSGTFGTNTNAGVGSTLTINDATIEGFDAQDGSNVTINGGDLGISFDAESGSIVVINDGTFGSTFNPNEGSDVTINGGEFGQFFTNEGTTTISGGTFDDQFFSPGDIWFLGSDFAVNGIAIDGDSFDAVEGSLLTGILQDGSTIEFDLFSVSDDLIPITDRPDFFGGVLSVNDTTINIVGVPEPSSLSLLALGALGLIARRKRS